MLLKSRNHKSYDVAYKMAKNLAGKNTAVHITVPPWVLIEVRGNAIRLRNRTGTYHLFDNGSEEVVLPKNLMEALMKRIGNDLVPENK